MDDESGTTVFHNEKSDDSTIGSILSRSTEDSNHSHDIQEQSNDAVPNSIEIPEEIQQLIDDLDDWSPVKKNIEAISITSITYFKEKTLVLVNFINETHDLIDMKIAKVVYPELLLKYFNENHKSYEVGETNNIYGEFKKNKT
jgi:hypothetical protein